MDRSKKLKIKAWNLIVVFVAGVVWLFIAASPFKGSIKNIDSGDGRHVVEVYDQRWLWSKYFFTSVYLGEIKNTKVKRESLIVAGCFDPKAVNASWGKENEITVSVPPGKIYLKFEKVNGFNIIFN